MEKAILHFPNAGIEMKRKIPKKVGKAVPPTRPPDHLSTCPPDHMHSRPLILSAMLLLLFSLLIYANTLTHEYALDDQLVITGNSYVKKGLSGLRNIFTEDSFTGFFGKQKTLVAGGRYRPLSIASYAMEYALLGRLNPKISHLFNILFYAATGILILLVLHRLSPKGEEKKWFVSMPFIAAILYLAHPLHTEAVANIKGRDEIFSMLFSILSLYTVLRYLDSGRIYWLILTAVSFFLGLLSKENAILFVVLIPLAVHCFTQYPFRKQMLTAGFLLFTAILFVGIRSAVLGYVFGSDQPPELLNNPFLFASSAQKLGTILHTLGLYLKLLLVPYPLTHDYYPWQIPLTGMNDIQALVPLIIYLLLIAGAIYGVIHKTWTGFGLTFYLLTLFIVSNLVFPVGTLMNERFLFMPSFGFVVILAWLVTVLVPRRIPVTQTRLKILIPVLILVPILSSYSILTFLRNRTWKDDFTLFTTDVLVSGNSTKCNTSAGGMYIEKAQADSTVDIKESYYEKAVYHLERALEIYPRNRNAWILLGNAKILWKNDRKSGVECYLTALRIDPQEITAVDNTLKVLKATDNKTEGPWKLSVAREIYALQPESGPVNYILGILYGQVLGSLDSARLFLNHAVALMPGDPSPLKDLGVVLGMLQDYEGALRILQKAAALDPQDPSLQQNIALTRILLQKK
jgi:Flp pilus assembly protein TadD